MNFQNLKIETADRIAVVTLNRPEALNALNRDLLSELSTFLIRLLRMTIFGW